MMKTKPVNRPVEVNRCLPHSFSAHSRKWSIGMLKHQRLAVKNARREMHGLAKLNSYAEL